MRPLRLEILGLRSYRTKCEIDFSNVDLLAIVGDTGVGKSSLLEAINYALYNRPTWEAGPKQLITDGLNTMVVSLDFHAEGRTYRVTRSTSRGTYPLPVHKLTCLSDPVIQGRDGEHAVSEEICRLIGLDASAFKSAVILPQGRFQTLLEATSADRTRLLKGILRLEQIGQVRDEAAELARRIRPPLEDLQRERLRLFEDPDAVAKNAEIRSKEAKERGEQLRAAQRQYAEAERKRQESEEVIRELTKFAQLLQKSLTAPPVGRLESLMPLEKQISEAETLLQASLGRFRADEAKYAELLGQAGDKGEGVVDLSRAEALLIRLIRDVPDLEKERKEIDGQTGELVKQEAALAEQVRQLVGVKAAAAAAEGSESTEREAVVTTERTLTEARDRLRSWREALSHESTAAQNVKSWQELAKQRKTELTKAQSESSSVKQLYDAARSWLEEIRRKHAAVHAAQGLSPGQPCPICSRELPADFVPPIAADEGEARTKVAVLEGHLQQAQADEISRKEQLNQATGNLAAAKAALESSVVGVKQAREELAESVKVSDPTKSDDELMQPIVKQVAAANQKLTGAQERAKRARSVAETTAAQVESRQQWLTESRRLLKSATTRLVNRRAQCEKDHAALPVVFRPQETLVEADLNSALERLRVRLGELRTYEQAMQDARASIRNSESQQANLRQKREKEISQRRRAIGADLATFRERISRACEFLSLPDAVTHDEQGEGSLAEELAVAKLLEASSTRLIDVIRERSKLAKIAATIAAEKAAKTLSDRNVTEPAAIDEAIVAAATDAQLASAELATAKAQRPRAIVLDQAIGQGARFVAGLDELGRLLTDGRFIGELVTRKQTILLHLASDILGSITSGRFGFAEDFEVVDRGTGQPRSAKTLSGGEKFLASLALALALVELAGRSGGRLEALFLDEGFGSLDSSSLDEALGELERRAGTGRLVAVVSHLRSVAERIENVLMVTKTATGSAVRWAADDESDELMQETVEAGLLA